jgi:hypothetical protein
MFSREVIDRHRIRRITGSFSWLDHRLLCDGHLQAMSSDEMLLYFFFVLAGDRHGISFYHYEKICHLLKIDRRCFSAAQNCLLSKSFIAYQEGRVQVLQLPEKENQSRSLPACPAKSGSKSLKEILAQIAREGLNKGVR